MIETIESYIGHCDNCQKTYESKEDFCVFPSIKMLFHSMKKNGWIVWKRQTERKVYCGCCAKLKDGKLIVSNSRFKTEKSGNQYFKESKLFIQ